MGNGPKAFHIYEVHVAMALCVRRFAVFFLFANIEPAFELSSPLSESSLMSLNLFLL